MQEKFAVLLFCKHLRQCGDVVVFEDPVHVNGLNFDSLDALVVVFFDFDLLRSQVLSSLDLL